MHIMFSANTSWYVLNFRGQMIRELLESGQQVSVLAPVDEYTDQLRAMGCNFFPLVMDNHGTSPLQEAKLLFSFLRRFRQVQPDIVLSFSIKNNIYGAIAARASRIPIIPNVSGLGPAFANENWLNKVVLALYRLAFGKLPIVFFQNQEDRDLFIEKKLVRAEQTERLPGSGVNLRRFTAEPLGTNENVVFLLFARLIWQKGVAEFVQAGQRLKTEGRTVTCQILGFLDIKSRDAIGRTQMEAWVAEGSVDYLGSSDDVRAQLRNADCVVLPSYYREGVPRGLLEAAAMARPIITTDAPGCRDVVDDGETGLLCPPQDVEALTTSMRRIAEMSRLERSNMGLAGRAKMEREFDEVKVIDTYRQWIERLVKTKR